MKKKSIPSILHGTLFIFTSLTILISCNNDNSVIEDEPNSLTMSSAILQSELDDVSSGIDDIVESVYFNFQNSTVSKNTVSKNAIEPGLLSDCTTITKVLVENLKTITIDFGDGCTNKNDNLLSGKIIMEIVYNLEDNSISAKSTFEDFYFNTKKIEGEVNKIRIKFNENGNREANIEKNIKITWADGSTITVQGERKREWIEGFDSKIWSDNVFLITGFWIVTNQNGVERTSTILEPLKRNSACKFIISGIVEIKKEDEITILNYGNDVCDDLAIATKNGFDHEFHLRKKRKK